VRFSDLVVPLAVTAITKWCNQCGVMKAAAAGRLGRYQAEAGCRA
jgi:hypothetical protein